MFHRHAKALKFTLLPALILALVAALSSCRNVRNEVEYGCSTAWIRITTEPSIQDTDNPDIRTFLFEISIFEDSTAHPSPDFPPRPGRLSLNSSVPIVNIREFSYHEENLRIAPSVLYMTNSSFDPPYVDLNVHELVWFRENQALFPLTPDYTSDPTSPLSRARMAEIDFLTNEGESFDISLLWLDHNMPKAWVYECRDRVSLTLTP